METSGKKNGAIIYPSSFPQKNISKSRLNEMEVNGISIVFIEEHSSTKNENRINTFNFTKPVTDRIEVFKQVFCDPKIEIIFFGRGGYGASDLLPFIPWDKFKNIKKKTIIGFSDTTSILINTYHHLNWKTLHAPMPNTSLWGKESNQDIQQLLSFIPKQSTFEYNYHQYYTQIQKRKVSCGVAVYLFSVLYLEHLTYLRVRRILFYLLKIPMKARSHFKVLTQILQSNLIDNISECSLETSETWRRYRQPRA